MTGQGVAKLAIALAAREAMREHRKGKPIAFQLQTRPPAPTKPKGLE